MLAKAPDASGRDYYSAIYRSELDEEAQWLRLTSRAKFESIRTLLRAVGHRPKSLLEIGCGTGAVLEACKAGQLAERYFAIDYSGEALAYLRTRNPDIEVVQADVTAPEFRFSEPVDVVVCTHVLEHLEQPRQLLAAMRDRFDCSYLILEVPLEDLVGHRLKWRGRDRTANLAGHVQFFTASSFEKLLHGSGLRIDGRRRYVPILSMDTIRSQARRYGHSPAQVARTVVTNCLLPSVTSPLWSRLYYAHYAVICRRA